MQTTRFYDKLESWRGIAAFAVVVFHSPFFQYDLSDFAKGSYLFVDFFFVLSGFVMQKAYAAKIEDGLKFRDYFVLRLGRIYPLHLALLLMWLVWVLVKWRVFESGIELANPFEKNTFASFVSNIFLVHSLNIHNYTSWNYPSWSVSVEFAVYLVFFAFVWATRKINYAVLPLIISLGAYYYVFGGDNWTKIDYTVIGGFYRCAGGFFAGVFLSRVFEKIEFENIYLTNFLEFAAASLVVWSVKNSYREGFYVYLPLLAFFCAVYVFAQKRDGALGKILKLKPFVWAGKYSYSIYMWHALVLDVAFSFWQWFYLRPTERIYFFQNDRAYLINAALMLIIFALSVLTYRLIEKRGIEKSKAIVRHWEEVDETEERSSIFA